MRLEIDLEYKAGEVVWVSEQNYNNVHCLCDGINKHCKDCYGSGQITYVKYIPFLTKIDLIIICHWCENNTLISKIEYRVLDKHNGQNIRVMFKTKAECQIECDNLNK